MRAKRQLKYIVFLLSVLLGQPLGGFAQAAPDEPADEPLMVRRGREMFSQYCASCHGLSGKGDGPLADTLKKPPTDLTQISKKADGVFPHAKVHQFIDGERAIRAHGSRDMPIWGKEFRRTKPDSTVRLQLSAFTSFIEYIQE
jgi:mono/diheme cytochrome c family protein